MAPALVSPLGDAQGWAAVVLTYLAHGAAWAAAASLLNRYGRATAATSYSLWRLALFAPLLTSALSLALPAVLDALGRAGHPMSSLRLAATIPFRVVLPVALERADGAPSTPLESWLTVLGPIIATIGAGSILLGLLRFVQRSMGLAQVLRERSVCIDSRWNARLLGLLPRTRATGVRLTQSSRAHGPLSLGRGEICVPRALLASMSDVEVDAVLAHELAHIERRDAFWFPAASFVETVLWLHPFNRALSARMRYAAELACDDRAVSLTGEPAALAQALASVAESALQTRQWAPLPSLAHSSKALLQRVTRLLAVEGTQQSTVEPRWLAPAVVMHILLGASLTAFHVEAALRGSSLPTRSALEHRISTLTTADATDPLGFDEPATLALRERVAQLELTRLLAQPESLDPEGPRLLELQQELRHVHAMQDLIAARSSVRKASASDAQ